MSIGRLLHEFRPLFRMLEEPLTRSPGFGYRSRSLFDDPFFANPREFSRPAVDVTEEGNNYILEADLPGVKKENIEVRVGEGGRSVTIEGKLFSRQQSRAAEASQAENSQETAASSDCKYRQYFISLFSPAELTCLFLSSYRCYPAVCGCQSDFSRTALVGKLAFHTDRLASSSSGQQQYTCEAKRRSAYHHSAQGRRQGQRRYPCPVMDGPPQFLPKSHGRSPLQANLSSSAPLYP